MTLPPGRLRVHAAAQLRRLAGSAVTVLRWEGVILLAAFGFGVVSVLSTRWFYLFAFLSAAFLSIAWLWASGDTAASERYRKRAQTLGFWVWGALLALLGLAVFWRFTEWWMAALFGVVYLAIGAWNLIWLYRRERQSSAQFRQSIALSVVPILLAWIVNSTVYQVSGSVVSQLRATDSSAAEWSARRDARRERLGASDATVAVALSGGGYRAAAVHAGGLWVLEEAGFPIDYLSTVSGGSIVGASYAMGMSADGFRERLKLARPGLPNDLGNFYAVFAQLFVPGYGSGDTYANHFKRAYFRERRLEDTGPPLLIVNTTRYSDGTRRAFWAETDGQLALGRVVAASAAFPVAFDPVPIGDESYVDGGVVENLGIAGLQHYFDHHIDDARLAELIPDVLILSDAGLIPEAPQSWSKPSVLQMASRAQQMSYFAMHQWIYSFYTDGAYARDGDTALVQPFVVTAGRLWPELPPGLHGRPVNVFVMSPATEGERSRFAGDEDILDAVSGLDTLKELTPAEADAAFWVGAKLVETYLPELCAAAGIDCRDVELGAAPPVPD